MSGPKHDTEPAPKQKSGIMCDTWKVPIFRKELRKAGFDIEKETQMGNALTVLSVSTSNMVKLNATIQKAVRICARKRGQ